MIQTNPVFVAEHFTELKVSAYEDCDGDVVVVINGTEYIITATEALELAHVIAQATAPEGMTEQTITFGEPGSRLPGQVPPAMVLEREPEVEPEDILASLFNHVSREQSRLGTAGQARQVPSDFI